tara:strand:+ start:941 stop:1978 length:1038 start_codon:yes stop_codon:yes gene_type:complete
VKLIPQISSWTNIGKSLFSGITGFTKNLFTSFKDAGSKIVGGATGFFSGLTNSATGVLSTISNPTERLAALKDNIPKAIQDTAKLPSVVTNVQNNILNTDKLTSKNFVQQVTDSAGNAVTNARGRITEQLIPPDLASIKRQAGISLNTSDIIGCIGDKIKDLFGIFTVSLGIPTFDMFKVPDFAGISDNIADSFDDMFASINGAVTDTIDGIANMLTLKRINIINQQEIGRLTLGKFLGCDVDINVTSREKRDATNNPNILTQITNEATEVSKDALNKISINEANNRVQGVNTSQEKLKGALEPLWDPTVYKPGKYDLNIGVETSNEMRGVPEPGLKLRIVTEPD